MTEVDLFFGDPPDQFVDVGGNVAKAVAGKSSVITKCGKTLYLSEKIY